MSVIRVLITGVGHPIAEGTLAGLQAAGEDSFFVVGVDLPERGRGFPWTDRHYVAPPPGTPDFVPRLLDICQREDVQVVVPWSDDEVEAVSEARDAFEVLGCALLCGPRRSIRRTLDKGTLLTEMSQTDIPTPRFQLPGSPAEVEAAAMSLGYPGERVVVKPRKGTCSRGVWILDRDTDLVNPYPGPGQQITLEGFVSFLDSIGGAGERVPTMPQASYGSSRGFHHEEWSGTQAYPVGYGV